MSKSSTRGIHCQEVASGEDGVMRYKVQFADTSNKKPLTFADWIRLVQDDDDGLGTEMTTVLRKAPYKALRFETPGVAGETYKEQLFEFALVNDPSLGNFAAQQDPRTFAEHLKCKSANNASNDQGPAACAFANLGGDARLVAPRDWSKNGGSNDNNNESNHHGHIANFMRGATMEQATEVWKIVATTLQEELANRPRSEPLWFSTAGDGVAWLHFRLDSRPKYYRYRPFKEFSS
ncbi:MAG: hypothetical protein SGILL_004653 [Bacillariaceae sp.]